MELDSFWVISLKDFKPMLFPNEEVDPESIHYPIGATIKYDGVRLIFKDGEMYNRSMKVVPNKQLHRYFKHIKEYSKDNQVILDGEFYIFDTPCREITSHVTSHNKPIPSNAYFLMFDSLNNKATIDTQTRYYNRFLFAESIASKLDKVKMVKVMTVHRANQLKSLFTKALEIGHEGLVLRDLNARYKFGRTTLKEGIAYKMKPYSTYDAKIIDYKQRLENTNESFTNELGYATKRNTKDAKEETGILATLTVELEDGTIQDVSMTGDLEWRRNLWNQREGLVGKTIEFKGMSYGKKDKLRHPIFLRFREDK